MVVRLAVDMVGMEFQDVSQSLGLNLNRPTRVARQVALPTRSADAAESFAHGLSI